MALFPRSARCPVPFRVPGPGHALAAGLALLVVGVVWSGPVHGDPLPESLDLKKFRSRHYDVVTNAEPRKVKEITEHMDRVYRAYLNQIGRAGFHRRFNNRMKLYVLNDRRDYMTLLESQGINGAGTGGMFFAKGTDVSLASYVVGRSSRRMYATLQHEGFHQFAYMMIGELPVWVNEGLAEYFGDAALVDGRLELGQVGSDRVMYLRGGRKRDALSSFDKLLTMSHEAWRQRVQVGGIGARLLYDQSWSIVHFLVHADGGRYRKPFMAYLRYLGRGIDSAKAFERAFGADNFDAFEKRWGDYVDKLNPNPAVVAHTRLSVLAEGLQALAERHREPASLAELQRELKRIKFETTFGSHGAETTYSADDDELFEPPHGHAPGVVTDMTIEANPVDGLPPIVTVSGLPRPVRIKWDRDVEGNLVYEVVYERAEDARRSPAKADPD